MKKSLLLTLFISFIIGNCFCDSNTQNLNAIVKSKNTANFTPAKTSIEMAKNMTIGWNLGNTFDATGRTGLDCEMAWQQPRTTREMIKGIKAAGFKTIRIPVSWHDHVSGADYKIDEAWINRVKEVVTWSIDEGLCVIINIHHDNMAASKLRGAGFALSPNPAIQEKSTAYITSIWKQVAESFNSFDNRLVFELLNEPRDINGEVWKNEWWVQGAKASEANKIINSYEQAALNVIRKTGGNNANRFIMVPSYSASANCSYGFKMPEDSAKDRLLYSVHAYTPYSFAMESPGAKTFSSSHQSELNGLFNSLYTNYVAKGIGVVIGETGATHKNNDEERQKWANFFFSNAYKKGMPSFIWDNGVFEVTGNKYDEHYGYYIRSKQRFYSGDFIKAAMSGVGIDVELVK